MSYLSSPETRSRAARLDRVLNDLLARTPEVEAAAVMSFDGLPMASAMPPALDEDRVAAMSAALLSLGERAAQGLGRGALNQIYIEGEYGTVFLVSARDEAVLMAVSTAGSKVGMMRYEVRQAADQAGEVLASASPVQDLGFDAGFDAAFDQTFDESTAPSSDEPIGQPEASFEESFGQPEASFEESAGSPSRPSSNLSTSSPSRPSSNLSTSRPSRCSRSPSRCSSRSSRSSRRLNLSPQTTTPWRPTSSTSPPTSGPATTWRRCQQRLRQRSRCPRWNPSTIRRAESVSSTVNCPLAVFHSGSEAVVDVKLEGSLDAFSLPDVFQLLMSTRKTGGLHVRRADAHGVVYFSSGALCGATSDVRRQVLARRLVSTCAVSDEALGAAVDRAAVEPGTGVVRALAELGVIDPDVLQGAAHEQVVDTLFDVLRWPDGNFSFAADENNPDDVGLLLEADTVVSQARERLAHWESIAPHLPDAGTVLALAPAVGADPVIRSDEWALLARVDGTRPVAAVVELTGGSEYVVVSQLAELVERGLLVSQSSLDDQGSGSAAIAARSALLERLEGGPARPAAVATVAAVSEALATSLVEPTAVVEVDAKAVLTSVDDQVSSAAPAAVEESTAEESAEEPRGRRARIGAGTHRPGRRGHSGARGGAGTAARRAGARPGRGS